MIRRSSSSTTAFASASLVIAGDEQQMPPTNFFKKKSAGEDIEMDDLESILDDALALNMPQCYLSWHDHKYHLH